MRNSPDLSLIIPVYNEEGNLLPLYQRILAAIEIEITSFEIIFVNDGSSDSSIQIIQKIAEKDKRVHYMDLSRNFGHQVAVTAGLENCSGKKAIIMDADLQDPPEIIPQLLQKAKEGFEVVYARRKSRKGENFFKKITANFFYRILARITTIDIPLDTGDFRLIDKKVIDVLKQMPEQQKFLRGQIAWAGFNQGYIEFDRDPRHSGKTNYSLRKMIRFAFDGISSFSDLPLKIATISGFICSGIAFLLILYTLHSRLILKDFEKGWASEMLSILFIGGIQLIAIGIIGEYISRISVNVKNRPLYVVKNSTTPTIQEKDSEKTDV